MKAKDSSIPAGRHFLPGTTAESMREKHPEEADPKAAEMLLAYIMRKEGRSIRQICAALNRPYSTIRGWLVRAVQLGVGGRYDILNPGTPGRLDAAQLGQLRADLIAGPQSCGLESGTWTARLVAEHVRRRFGVQYRTVSMYDILHNLGFSCKRPRHPEPASEPEKRAFKKKKARDIIRDNPGHTVAAPGEASHIIGWDARSSWYSRGRPATAPVTLSRKRFHSLGALVDGDLVCRFYDRANGDSFIDMLGHLRKLNLVDVFYWTRNTLHNGGIVDRQSEVPYKGHTYKFEIGKEIEHATWGVVHIFAGRPPIGL